MPFSHVLHLMYLYIKLIGTNVKNFQQQQQLQVVFSFSPICLFSVICANFFHFPLFSLVVCSLSTKNHKIIFTFVAHSAFYHDVKGKKLCHSMKCKDAGRINIGINNDKKIQSSGILFTLHTYLMTVYNMANVNGECI